MEISAGLGLMVAWPKIVAALEITLSQPAYGGASLKCSSIKLTVRATLAAFLRSSRRNITGIFLIVP